GAGVIDGSELHRVSVNKDPSGIGLVVAGQDLYEGRFAGAVVAKDAERLTPIHAERDAGKCGDRAKSLHDFLGPDCFWRPNHAGPRRAVARDECWRSAR